MGHNEDLCNLNRWARCWYSFQVTGDGNTHKLRDGMKIKITYWSFDMDAGCDVIAGYIKLEQIPSHFNNRTRKCLGRGYRMPDMCFDCADLEQVMHDMHLEEEKWEQTVMGHALKRSDLYYIEELFVEPKFRNKGLGSHILRSLSKNLRLHMHEYKPVIAVIPYPLEYKPEDPGVQAAYDRLVAFYKRNSYSFPRGSTNTMIYCLE